MSNYSTISIEDGNQQDIMLLNPLRVLHGKRVVFEASWEGKTVLAKLFTKERHWQREQKGLSYLSSFKLASPRCLFAGRICQRSNLHHFGIKPEQQLYVLILEFYKNAKDFRSQWRSDFLSDEQRKELFSKMMVLLAQHHEVGVIQNDLHLGNFLIVDGDLITIDGDAVEHNRLLSIKECYQQLGILLAQSFPKYDVMLETLLPHYFEERKLEIKRHAITKILKSRTVARNIAKKNWIKKAYRESSQFKVVKTFNSHICIARAFVSDELESKIYGLIENAEDMVEWTDRKYTYKATHFTQNIRSERRYIKENEASIYWVNAQLKLFFGEENSIIPVALVLSKIGSFHKSGFYVHATVMSDN